MEDDDEDDLDPGNLIWKCPIPSWRNNRNANLHIVELLWETDSS